MIKRLLPLSLILLFFLDGYAQIPAGYYSSATGSGYTLKTQLHNIIDNHAVRTYTQLWYHYDDTDLDIDGYIWDMYSENPSGLDPYNFTWSINQCGTYVGESDCYNREHSFPKSWWGGSTAVVQYTDIHHVVPTDGYVNLQRGNLSYGEISSPTWISSNGTKKGPARSGLGYTGTVFEPLDEYKGDFARIYFYMATRYEDIIATWPGSAMLDGSGDHVFTDWALEMLLEWHANDPVSQKEIDRNNTIYYQVQGNRNPFIDHPEYAQVIWGGCAVNPPSSTTEASRCGPGLMTLTAVPGTGGNTIRWYLDNSTSTVFYTALVGNFNFLSTTYTLFVSSYDTISGCESTRVPITGTVYPLPSVSFSGLNTSYLVSDGTASLTGSPIGGIFSGNGISGNSFDPSNAGLGTHSITYSYTDGNSCTSSITNNVNVINAASTSNASSDLVISAVYDGPLSGGNPKGIELYVQNDIADLSIYGLGSASNGLGTDGVEFTFPSVSATAGDYIYCVATATGFTTFMGFTHDYNDISMGINGDDAIELFKNNLVVDVFGDANTSGFGQVWEYTNGWAARKNCTGPNGGNFDTSNWIYSGIDALDGESSNATAVNPIPIGTYSCPQTNLIITGVYDGPLLGGHPKGIEFFVTDDIADLSIYGFGSANNGGGTDGQEFVFAAVPASAGDYVYVAADSAGFFNFMGFNADYIAPVAAAINGDDAIELFKNGTVVVDVFGDINVDGTGQAWEYLDGWTFRKNCTNNDGNTFFPNNWIYSGIDALDGEFTNASASNPIPAGTYGCEAVCSKTFGTDYHIACNAYTWINGVTYTSSTNSVTDTLVNSQGCDSIVTLNLTINQSTMYTDVVSACNAYTWINGITYSTSNNSATFTLPNSVGCDSVITLNLTIYNPTYSIDSITTCQSSFTWIDGVTYDSSNYFATFVLVNSVGCDSVISLSLTINEPSTSISTITTCAASYTWINGNTYTSNNNTAVHTLTNANGCDSVISLDLMFNTFSGGVDNVSTCSSSYTWINGNTYTSNNDTATYTIVGGSALGCDSIVTLNLTINQPNTGTDIVTACSSFTWVDGNTYTSSNNTATHTFVNSAGCDSVVTLNLTINQPTVGIDMIITCASSITWIDGNIYSTNNNSATHVLTNALGCDSTVTLNLTFASYSAGTDIVTTCDSYLWIDGNTYSSSNNNAMDTLVGGSAQGCDSIVTLNLTINESNTGIDMISACDSYQWIDGNTYTASNNTATHTLINAAGCDSTVTLDLIVNANISTTIDTTILEGESVVIGANLYDSAGTYVDSLMSSRNCDSIVTINILKSPNGFDQDLSDDIFIYPNPNKGTFTLELSNYRNGNEAKIINVLGKEIMSINIKNRITRIDLTIESGLYFLIINEEVIKIMVEK